MSARKKTSPIERLEDFLLLEDAELLERLPNTPLSRIRSRRSEAALALCPEPLTVQELLQRGHVRHISTTLKELDRCLRGGIPVGSITEFVGPATVGKSQFCFSIAVLEAAPAYCGGGDGTVIYYDTEGKTSITRMASMIDSKWSYSGTDLEYIKRTILDHILIVKPGNSASLMKQFQDLDKIVRAHEASLIIVDSIAAILRSEFGHAIVERQKLVGEQAARLKDVAHRFNIPVLVTNQVTAAIGQSMDAAEAGAMYDRVTPAMGTKWAHCVNTRVSLERLRDGKRLATIRKSPSCPNDSVGFVITEKGIERD